MKRCISRRRVLAGAATGLLVLPARSALGYAANERLDLALVGVGGRGSWFVDCIPRLNQRFVALCDVDERRAAEGFKKLPEVPKFRDFRKMLAEKGKEIDGVIVATPDNTHAVAAMAALRAGKPVYCEKPLTHDVCESRVLRQMAAETKLPTQMGNQGTASADLRRGVDWIRAGRLGAIKEVNVYNGSYGGGRGEPPKGEELTPKELDWDLWLGPAAWRPYHSQWMKWHTWRDFATSNMGNWASHSGNLPFMALKVDALWHAEPDAAARIRVTPETSDRPERAFPQWARLVYDVPPRAGLPAIRFIFHMGGPSYKELIERIEKAGVDVKSTQPGKERFTAHAGCWIVGSEGSLYAIAHNTRITLLPAEKFRDVEDPPATLPRSRGHEQEWLDAIRGGKPPLSSFAYSGPLNEFLMLGNIATLLGRPIEYDPVAGQCPGDAEAIAALRRTYRDGWML